MKKLTGKCLCGKVSVTAEGPVEKTGACHCGMCRKWSGSFYMAIDCGEHIEIEGEALVTRYQSSDWAERGFCKACGTNLFYYLKEPATYMCPPGLFDNVDDFVLDHQIFIDHKPGFYSLTQETHNMTEAEVFAKFT